jgi:hypothetical protein
MMKKTVRTLMGICLLSLFPYNYAFANNNSNPAYKKSSSASKGKVLTKLPSSGIKRPQADEEEGDGATCIGILYGYTCSSNESTCQSAALQWGCGTKKNDSSKCCTVLQV